ncbi:MAG: helix-turn-helix domain-containing protein [Clostridiales bacterium]|jgi:AraC-like DNA-binding protein|nr:helix-turn-helix domain-containing protein [Clostridiales bacterium]MBQ1293921.1 helix-turn-helix domain-containing protein [Clostridiales bacterium]MBQ1571647.1 helix-turn-helix domain-containing protein [Clostridiales bacterium]MBQ5768241.1 helix-turn-helix domain-containing protein [Clostridiales bacterium]
MQFNDNSVPGKYQQPIGSFAGRIVSNDVEEVDFIPGSNMRIWYNNRSEDYPVHRHSCLEITIPIEKSYTYIFDDRTIILKEKEILFVPPDMLHKIAGTKSGIRFIYLFNVDFLKGFFDYSEFQKLIKEPLLITPDTHPDIYSLIFEKFMEINDLYFFYSTTVKEISIFGKLMDVFGMLMKKDYSDSLAVIQNDKQREVYIKFKTLAEWLAMHSSENISMDEAATHVGYSKFHFARLFKEYTGMTFNDYQTTLKLKEVERQLADTDLQISDIAMSCGFNNLTSLSRCFKKQYGCSPSQFRNRIRRSKKRSLS